MYIMRCGPFYKYQILDELIFVIKDVASTKEVNNCYT